MECDVMTPLSHQSPSLCLCLYLWVFPSLPLSLSKLPLSFAAHRNYVSKAVMETGRLGVGGQREVGGEVGFDMLLMVDVETRW